jgi:mono/diheme cytochrome c family protein
MFRSPSVLVAIVVLSAAAMLWAMSVPPHGTPAPEPTREKHDPLTTRLSDEPDPGQLSYQRYCSGCHGLAGDGNGPAARFLYPKPRDFTRGLYKFVSRPSGQLPTDDDLLRTITYGLSGTAMPSWRFLPHQEKLAIVRHLKTFLPFDDYYQAGGIERWQKMEREAEPAIPFHRNPYALGEAESVAEALAKGKELYHGLLRCWSCHPAYAPKEDVERWVGSPVPPTFAEAVAKPDDWGQTILPPDFPTTPLKSVRTLEDLYRVLLAGVGGTAMPSWAAVLDAEQAWAVTLYVGSLRKQSALRKLQGSTSTP